MSEGEHWILRTLSYVWSFYFSRKTPTTACTENAYLHPLYYCSVGTRDSTGVDEAKEKC